MRRRARWTIRLFFLLLFAGICWGGWYGYNKGFGRHWREYVAREIERRSGVKVSFHRLAIDPFRGLVARNVVVVDAKDPSKELAVINRIVLDINYGNLIHRQPFLNAIDLREANLTLPLGEGEKKTNVKISHFNAHVELPPHQIHVTQMQALLYGVQISASGRLINPEAFRPSAPSSPTHAQLNADLAETIIGELKKLHFDAGPALVELQFSGDLAAPSGIFVEAKITSGQISRGAYKLAGIEAALKFHDGFCTVKKFTIRDMHGSFEFSGIFDPQTGGEFRAHSNLDLQALAREFGFAKPLDELVFYSTPVIDALAKIEQGDKMKISLLGNVALGKFAIRSSMFDGLGANFSWDGTHWYLSDVRLTNRTGELHASALSNEDGFRAKFHSSIDPKAFIPFLNPSDAELLRQFDFEQPPHIEFHLSGPAPLFEQCSGEGEIRLGRTRLRGIPMISGSTRLHIKNKAVTYENFRVDRPEGAGTGTFVYDFGKHEVRLDHIKAKLIPHEVILWTNPDLLEAVRPYRFHRTPNVSINGVVPLGGKKGINLEVLVEAPEGMDYVFLKKTLSLPKIAGRLLFTDDRLQIDNLTGKLFSGRIRGGADISFSKQTPGYSASIAVEKMDFEKLTNLYFNYKGSKGELSGEYRWHATSGDARTMEGKGSALVTNGNVFAIPVLGPLSNLIAEVIPGAGYSMARRASTTFTIRDGVIHTDDLVVQGNGFDLLGSGDLFFLDDKMDFRIRMNAQGIPGVVLFPVSKLLEYISDESLSKPVWRPVNLPRGFVGQSKR